MSSRLLVAATTSLALLSATACGGSSSGGGSSASSTDAPKVSITAAMKSDDAATKACQTLIGNGSKETVWLSGTSPTGTTAKGAVNEHGFSCVVHDANQQYAGFHLIQGREAFDAKVQSALSATDTKAEVASALNPDATIGAYSSSVREDQNGIAVDDLQTIVNLVGP